MKSKVAFLFVAALAVFFSSVDAQCCGEKKPASGSDAKVIAKVVQNAAAPETGLTTGTLVALLGASAPMTLIDARANPTDLLPGAKVLTDDCLSSAKTLARTCGSKDRLIVTYCSGPQCSASTKMAAKLRAAGYTNVIEYREGVAGWKSANVKLGGDCCGTCGGTCGGKGDDAGAAVCPVTGKSAKVDKSGKSGCTSCPAMKAKAASAPVSVIHTAVLKTFQDADVPMVILDARSGQFDDGNRIPGAVAFHCADCVGKPETLKKVAPSKNQLMVTYCNGQKCPLSTKLARSLRAAGYTNVIDYKAGMAGWKKAGLKTVSQKAQCCGSCGDAQACSKKKSAGSSCPSGSCSGK